MHHLPLLVLLAAGSASTVESRASVPASQDRCLLHTVRELQMSARQLEERRWSIGPQFIHPSIVEGGTVQVHLENDGARSTVVITVQWPGGPKPAAVQDEIEYRVKSMVDMMSLACGAPPRSGQCTFTAPGATPAPCTP
jgi:hypothetical protein